MVLTQDGELLTFGASAFGQLGAGSSVLAAGHVDQPQAIGKLNGQAVRTQLWAGRLFASCLARPLIVVPALAQVTELFCGGDHTFALTANGELYSWGWGEYGQTGSNANNDVVAPSRVLADQRVLSAAGGYAHSVWVTEGGVYRLVSEPERERERERDRWCAALVVMCAL